MPLLDLRRDATRYIVILWVYLLVASASFSGYFSKYAFFDFTPRDSLVVMLDGTAHRPFVYRQLLPAIANLAEEVIPADVKQRFVERVQRDYPAHNWLTNTYTRATDAAKPEYLLRYHIVYALTFLSLLGAMLMLRNVCIELVGNRVAAMFAPLAFALVVPASNFWDFPELFFMTLAVWIAVRGKLMWLVPVALIATFNKESFLFFLVALYPFVRMRAPRSATLVCLSACVAVAVAVNVAVKLHYANNAGGMVELHLWDNLRFFLHPQSYLQIEYTYGIPLPKRINIVNLFIVLVIIRYGWPALPRPARQHALLVCAINIPLFLLFGFGDEIRALSMLHVSATLLLCGCLAEYLSRETSRAPATAPVAAANTGRAAPLHAALDLGER